MKAKELLKELMNKNGVTNAGMAKALDMTPQALWNLLNMGDRKGIAIDKVQNILDIMGYKLVVVPKAQNVKNGMEVE